MSVCMMLKRRMILVTAIYAWFCIFSVAAASWSVAQQVTIEDELQTLPGSLSRQQEADGEMWFNRMQNALRTKNFSASLVHIQGQRVELFRWLHGVSDTGNEIELLFSLNGPDVYLVRQNQQVSYFHPMISPYSLRSQFLFGPIPAAFYDTFEQISRGYSVVTMGGGRVLDRPAQHIRVVPKDQQRFGYSLWLDRDTGMLLRMATVAPSGDILEQIQLTSVDFPAELQADLLQVKATPMPPLVRDPDADSTIQHEWRQTWLPEGFSQIRSNHHRLPMTGIAADYFLYTDGMTRVSVYVSQDPRAASELAYEGLESLYTHRHADFSVTAVGRLPIETLQRIAASVAR